MKKNLLILSLVFAIFIIPTNALAKVEVSDLKAAVEEEISLFQGEESYKSAVKELKSYDISNYEESNKKVNVYLFRGSTCGHCFEAISFFARIYKDYGDLFNFKSYEVWNNSDNNELMAKVGKKLNKEISGVPFIIIGKKTFSGYTESYDNDIINTIKKEYKKDKSKRTDVIKTLDSNSSDGVGKDIISVLVILLVVAGIIFGIKKLRKNS